MSTASSNLTLGTILVSVVSLVLISYLGSLIQTVFSGPLSKYPGPKLRALSKLPGIYTTVTGQDATVRCALHEKFGPVVRVNPNELSFIGDAEVWDAIYGFKKGNASSKPIRDPSYYTVGVNGCPDVVSADEENHARQRKILSKGFSDKALRELEPVLKGWAEKMVSKLKEQVDAGRQVDLLKYINCATFDIMGDLVFSKDLGMLENGELSSWVQTIFAGFKAGTFWKCVSQYSSLTNWLVTKFLFNSKKVRVMQWENFEYCQTRMDARLSKQPERPDLWSWILAKSAGPERLTRDEHHSNSVLFMVAGTETTATALSGLIYFLHQRENHSVLQTLRDEIRGSFSSFKEVTFDSLARLKYLQAVLQEGLRMYPPAPSSAPRRTQLGGMSICGQFIPEDTIISVHPLATSRYPEHFKNPHEFHPDRWLGEKSYADDNLDSVQPFVVGPQNCLGKSLAWHEMRLLLVALIFSFDIELAPRASGWIHQKTYTLWEKKPLPCTLTSTRYY